MTHEVICNILDGWNDGNSGSFDYYKFWPMGIS